MDRQHLTRRASPSELVDVVHDRTAGWVTPVVLVDGRVAGPWEIGAGRKATIEVQPFGGWRGGARKELAADVDRVAAFLGRPLQVSVAAPLAGRSVDAQRSVVE
jgi:hypothetical protein